MFLHGKQPESAEPDKRKGPLWIIPTSRWKRIHLPYKPEFSKEDNRAIIEAINRANPDLLWIGMTAPKQEKMDLYSLE